MAMRLTGGYVSWLRKNAQRLLTATEISDEHKKDCAHYGKFVAYMRARPSTKQDESQEREASFRLASQLVRLAKCLAVVLNRKAADAEVMKRVRLVALDTARGQTLEIVRHLYHRQKLGTGSGSLVNALARPHAKILGLLAFLRQIGAVRTEDTKDGRSIRTPVVWRLTPAVYRLYKEVAGNEP